MHTATCDSMVTTWGDQLAGHRCTCALAERQRIAALEADLDQATTSLTHLANERDAFSGRIATLEARIQAVEDLAEEWEMIGGDTTHAPLLRAALVSEQTAPAEPKDHEHQQDQSGR